MTSISTNYIITIIALISLAQVVYRSSYMDERKNNFYLLSILANLFTLVGYIGRDIADHNHLIFLNYISNILIYGAGTLITYFLLISQCKKGSFVYNFATTVTAIALLVVFSSPLTNISFIINSQGYYERGWGYWITMALALVMFIIWIINMLNLYKYVEFKKRFCIILFAIIEASAVILQALDGKLKIIYIGSAFLLSIYYAFVMEVEGRFDHMTGVYSKRYYYTEISKLNKESEYLIFMIDGNGLKKINDSYGHDKGDLTIKIIGQTILKELGTHSKIFRLGGDEFVGISSSLNCNSIKDLINNISFTLEAKSKEVGFDITVAVGYVMHETGEDFLETLHRADKKMYEDKDLYYGRVLLS